MNKLPGTSADILAENKTKMKQLFPEVFTEDKIDFERLQEVLGEYVDDKEERYRFEWNGKSRALRLSQTQSTGTLRPCKEESKDWDTTENLYIEGDNLEVLKLLQKTYHNRIKMIYIDPPYNTGGDFVYKDDFKDNIKNYLEITGQTDEEGKKLSTNSEISGRYHTDWLNMMYPRLRLAKNLLTDDGVIFISIDDNEVDNLKKVCNEIFGEENFVEALIWKRRATPPNDRVIGKNHEYIIVYSKSSSQLDINLQPRSKELNSRYKNPDNDPNGAWVASDLSANGKGGRLVENCIFPIYNSTLNKDFYPPENKCWLYNLEKVNQLLEENRIGFREGSGAPYLKRYLKEVRQGSTLPTILDKVGFSSDSAKEIKTLFNKDVFEFAKPCLLLKTILCTGSSNCDIVLDFFSGSAITAHATIQLNAEDGCNRKFVMVQLPELTDEKSEAYKTGYKNICEIGKERIRRAGDKIKDELQGQQLKLGEEPKEIPDIGFKVFKLDSSNLKKWNPDYDNLEGSLMDIVSNYVGGRTQEDVLYEIMLKYGIDLTYPIETETVNGKQVFNIGFGSLFVCLADDIDMSIAKYITQKRDELMPDDEDHKSQRNAVRIVFKDNGFKDDSTKTNVEMELERCGFEEVVSV